jgi:hypothetical protein
MSLGKLNIQVNGIDTLILDALGSCQDAYIEEDKANQYKV